ncbi:MAG TPA: MarR family transcriptional regulator [Mycobacteriales bacterium]|jgi:DNA-binding MarR family transcriptional regulator|nr:MarR family transcriptional regulator [Mycobacteriales bacterium]
MAAKRDQATPSQDELTDALVGASRALIAIAVRSLADAADGLTLVQYRALVVLSYRGAMRVADLAEHLSVNSSTATRLCERLVRKELVSRVSDPDDGRATRIAITTAGNSVVAAVTTRRRTEISKIARRMPVEHRRAAVESLEAFTLASGVAPEQSWTLGWTS